MKSAETRLQARGIFQAMAFRKMVLRSVSWGIVSRGSFSEERESLSPSAILAPICSSLPRKPLRNLPPGTPNHTFHPGTRGL